jgi:DNA-binding NarL/FixJ family response regulator
VADDHAVLRAGLRLLIESQPGMTVADEAADGPEAIARARAVRPDVVVLDLVMPRTNGATTIRRLVQLGTRVVVLSMHDDRATVGAALDAGAIGYVVKKAADVELIAAIRAASRGRLFVDAARGAFEPPPRRRGRLSPREETVIRLVARGHTNREVAARLGVSVKTVETFRARACRKLELNSRAELVRYALRMNLVQP